jgi:TatD DNase family protein
MFIDSHCHLDFPEFQTRLPEVLANMAEAKVKNALCISVDLPDFPKVLKLAEDYPHLYASVGVHPDYEDTPEPTVEFLVETAKHTITTEWAIAAMNRWSGKESALGSIYGLQLLRASL